MKNVVRASSTSVHGPFLLTYRLTLSQVRPSLYEKRIKRCLSQTRTGSPFRTKRI